jgi:Ca2+-binding EF-hand superfamily protein
MMDTGSAAQLSGSAQSMADNYAASIGSSGLSESAASSAVARATEFIRVADSTSGVDLSDGFSGDEYLLVAQTISSNANLQARFQAFDAAIGDTRAEYFGQYGVEGRNLLDAAGNVAISADEAAAQFNDAAGFPAAAAEEAAGAEPAAEEAAEEEAPSSEEAADGEEPEGAAEAGGWSLSEFWAALLGLLDEDGDGKISPEEFAKGMRKLDTNGDGKLSKDELVAGGMSEAQAGELMTAMDENGDGAISTVGAGSELDTFVTELNANDDLEITQAELGELVSPPAGTADVNAELEAA